MDPLNSQSLKIALTGNPNCGKSTLFNHLTGLRQKTGNFPGVTIDKKTGKVLIGGSGDLFITDLPGAYSLIPKSEDEEITCRSILSDDHDVILVLADACNLKRSLYICTQLIDLNKPMVLAVNMIDEARKKGIETDFKNLAESLGIPVQPISAKTGEGIKHLLDAIQSVSRPSGKFHPGHTPESFRKYLENNIIPGAATKENIEEQKKETLLRYQKIGDIVSKTSQKDLKDSHKGFTFRLDNILTSPVTGFACFGFVMFIIFQAVFSWSELPSGLIDLGFAMLSASLQQVLPDGIFTRLLVSGVIPGLSGVFTFIPQIALLFFFISLLEDSGYMARISFLMDKSFRRTGLNGRSIIPLLGGMACAVPSVMSARTISNKKERLITILVTPLISCSARLPVYTLLISVVIPDHNYGIINLQGATLMLLYVLGFTASLGSAWVFKKIIKSKEPSYFMMEMPSYRLPSWQSTCMQVIDKVKIFLFDAGKVILAVSVIIWFLSSYGPADITNSSQKETDIKESFAGIMGKAIEPVIEPLGYDWKTGIGLITSFAAREVFVGTMSTIYHAGDPENTGPLKERLKSEINPKTGLPVFGLASGLSLILFYAFSMQCISTMAVVMRETRSRKWMWIQFAYMTGMAYIISFCAYQLLK